MTPSDKRARFFQERADAKIRARFWKWPRQEPLIIDGGVANMAPQTFIRLYRAHMQSRVS